MVIELDSHKSQHSATFLALFMRVRACGEKPWNFAMGPNWSHANHGRGEMEISQ